MHNLAFVESKQKEVLTLPINKLKIDMSYQRPPSLMHAKKIAKNYDPVVVGVLHVSERSDGFYYVVDGQHRLTAMKINGLRYAECLIYKGLTYSEECRLFAELNNIKKADRMDKAKPLLRAGDQKYSEINNVVESLGLNIDYEKRGKGVIRAFGAIEAVYDRGGAEDLREVLYILEQSLGKHRGNFQRFLVLGLHDFIREYRGRYDRKWLVNRLKKIGLDEWIMKAGTFQRAHNCDKRTGAKFALIQIYNHRKSEKNKL